MQTEPGYQRYVITFSALADAVLEVVLAPTYVVNPTDEVVCNQFLYGVIVEAANRRHARVLGERQIRDYIRQHNAPANKQKGKIKPLELKRACSARSNHPLLIHGANPIAVSNDKHQEISQ